MALTLLSSGLEPVDEKLALEFRDMESMRNERPLKSSRAKRHVALIEANIFVTPFWGSCELNSVVYRSNGNHTSHVLAACIQATNGGFDEKSKVFVEEYLFSGRGEWSGEHLEDLPKVEEGRYTAFVERIGCEDDDDLINCFRRWDSPASTRGRNDQLGVSFGLYDEFKGLCRDHVRFAFSGVMKAAKQDQTKFELNDSEYMFLKACIGDKMGDGARLQKIREATKWIVETVPVLDLYRKIIGSQLCAEIYCEQTREISETLVETMCQQIEEGEGPASDFETSLNRKRNRPTDDSLLKKGRKAVNSILREIDPI